MMWFIKKMLIALPHITIILALCFLAFLILDWYNPMMAFITNSSSIKLLAVFCVVSILSSVNCLITDRKRHCGNGCTRRRRGKTVPKKKYFTTPKRGSDMAADKACKKFTDGRTDRSLPILAYMHTFDPKENNEE